MGTHLIHRQILDLRFKDEVRAKAAMDQWSEQFQAYWQSTIAEVLDELDGDGRWIRLDRVEIDLGKIRENLSPEVFSQKLKEELKTQLLRQIPQNHVSESGGKTTGSLLPRDERKPLELLIYLLKNGRKPWWSSHSKKEGIRSLTKKLISEKNKEFKAWLQSESFTSSMLSRLENHLERKEIQEIIAIEFPEIQKQSVFLFQSLSAALSPEIYSKIELAKKWERSILEASFLPENQLTDPISNWIKSYLVKPVSSKTSFSPNSEALMELFVILIPADFTHKPKLEILDNVWTKWTQTPVYKKTNTKKSNLIASKSIEKIKFLESIKTGKAISNLATKEKMRKKSSEVSSQEKLILDETIPVSNSGLVLVAPFLPFLFRGLGLADKKQFVSKEAQNRAVLLLQALIDDGYSYEESDLLLNKILCGIEPSEQIEVSFSPSELEKEEIKNLLDSMVSQWTALKSTSGASMAKGFFPREGSLKRIGSGYQLTVPRLSIDILLNRLPWAISIIKLPWMNETLFTEW